VLNYLCEGLIEKQKQASFLRLEFKPEFALAEQEKLMAENASLKQQLIASKEEV